MRCLACGSDMVMVKAVPDDTMAVAGFEHHTFMCSSCGDTERRLVFSRHDEASEAEAVPIYAAPLIAPAGVVLPAVVLQDSERAAASAPGLLRRVLAKLRGGGEAPLRRRAAR
jgi:hypothetical protein